MTALSILQVLAPAPVGGLESVVAMLARGLHERGHAVRIAAIFDAPPRDHPFVDALASAGIGVTTLVVPGHAYARERAALAALIAESRPQLVHTHGYRPDVVDAGVAHGRGLPIVTTVHGFTGGGWKNQIYERLQRWSFRRFDAVIAVSRPLYAQLAARGISPPALQLLPNAFEPSAGVLGRAEARRVLGIPEDRFQIGWVGRLSREKGVDVMIEALACAPLQGAGLSIVGEGRERDAMRARAATLGIDERITWHGTIPGAGRLYAAFDAFALTSRTEGTPIALFEAMAASRPIVATRVGGVPDVVSEASAWLVPSEAPERIADALQAVRRAPDEARIRGRAARERVETVFAMGAWIARHEALYRGLVAERGHAR